MYVCGPTVYNDAHIGHARAYVVYDTIVRHLRFRGYEVTHVRNITDIDDKIINRANEEGVGFDEIATRYADHFNHDMRALGLEDPDKAPKATETVSEIIAMIESLISKGFAYEAQGDVYFSISTLKDYGKLSKKTIDDLIAGARVDPTEKKKEPLDFALWKNAKPGEPSWTSPWGEGRPGWHIECSAMAKKLLSDTIDIHAGGRDLIFPHHENEIAQSESANGKPFSTYWLHNGFVNMGKEKMSKSLGNVITIGAFLKKYHPEAIKLYFLTSHYRSPIDFSEEGIEEAARGLDRMYRVLHSIPATDGGMDEVGDVANAFAEAMDDDFNTAKAIAVLFDATKEANRLQKKADTLAAAKSYRDTIVRYANLIGLLCDDPAEYFKKLPGVLDVDRVQVENLIAQREEARRKKDFAHADQIRDDLQKMNVVLEDSPGGTTWRLKS